MQAGSATVRILDDVVDEAVGAEHDARRHDHVPAGHASTTPPTGADDDTVDEGVVDVPEAVRIAALEVREDLLHQQAAVDASLAVGQHGAVSVVVDLEELRIVACGTTV